MISADDPATIVGPTTRQIRELSFASLYVYSPSDARAASRLLCASIKTGHVKTLVDRAIQADAEARRSSSLASFIPAAAILVPVPGSSPSAWGRATPTGRLAVALREHGLGKGIWFGLRRVRAVRKSATAAPGARPSLRTHFDTIAVDSIQLLQASHLVLIDDVVTKGRTLLAAAMRLREIYPRADVRGFALLRTMGYSPVSNQLLMPCTGKIEWACDDARRSP
jgi:predicted amidophosphoribosyltransferase